MLTSSWEILNGSVPSDDTSGCLDDDKDTRIHSSGHQSFRIRVDVGRLDKIRVVYERVAVQIATPRMM